MIYVPNSVFQNETLRGKLKHLKIDVGETKCALNTAHEQKKDLEKILEDNQEKKKDLEKMLADNQEKIKDFDQIWYNKQDNTEISKNKNY